MISKLLAAGGLAVGIAGIIVTMRQQEQAQGPLPLPPEPEPPEDPSGAALNSCIYEHPEWPAYMALDESTPEASALFDSILSDCLATSAPRTSGRKGCRECEEE